MQRDDRIAQNPNVLPMSQRWRGLSQRLLRVAGMAALVTAWPVHAADDYLSELDAEVKKVEARNIDGAAGRNDVEAPAEVAVATRGTRNGASRDAFEGLLKQKYLGTFGFYKKLPERSRQEIFLEYQEGAPMAEVRKKIIDRLLQR